MRRFSFFFSLFLVVPFGAMCQDYVEAWHLFKAMGAEDHSDFGEFYCDLMFTDELFIEAFEVYRLAKRTEAQMLSLEYFASNETLDTIEASSERYAEIAFGNFLELGLPDQLEVYRYCLENDLIDDFTQFANFQRLWAQDLTSETFKSLILADNNVLGCRCSHYQYRKAIQNGDSIQALRFLKRARREFETLGLDEIERSFWSSVAVTTDGSILELNSLQEFSKERYHAERERFKALESLSEESQAFDLQQYSSASIPYNILERTNLLMTPDGYARYIRDPAYSQLDSLELSLLIQKLAPSLFPGTDSIYVDTRTNFNYDPIQIRQSEAILTSNMGDVSGAIGIIDFFPNEVVFDWLLENLDYKQGLLVNRRTGLISLINTKLHLYGLEGDLGKLAEIFRHFQSVASALEIPLSLVEILQQLAPEDHDYLIRDFLNGLLYIQDDDEFCDLARDAMVYANDSQFYRSLVRERCQRTSSKYGE